MQRAFGAMASVAREIALGTEARELVCSAALASLDATIATVVEPREGTFAITGSAGVPLERAEILVRGTGAPSTSTVVQSLAYDRYMPQTRPEDWKTPLDLFSLQYSSSAPVTAPAIPVTLRRIEALDSTKSKATRLLVFSQGLINGRIMDMNRVDVSARLGDTEIWELENVVGMDHPFHLHGFQFQVLDRNGIPETQRRWKDTVNIPKHETVRIIVRYDDHPGRWMFHCHILDHEDHGMMGILEVK